MSQEDRQDIASFFSTELVSNGQQEKLDWISLHGSSELKAMIDAGYESNTKYVLERLKIDYPDFNLISDRRIKKADTPPIGYLEKYGSIEGSYCGVHYISDDRYYIVIDEYLGKHQIAKQIEIISRAKSNDNDILEQVGIAKNLNSEDVCLSPENRNESKHDWIFLYGSDLLQESALAGYDVEQRYFTERIKLEYPGFKDLTDRGLGKTNSPSRLALKASRKVEGSIITVDWIGKTEYLTINDYLDRYTIGKQVRLDLKSIKYPFILTTLWVATFATMTSFFLQPYYGTDRSLIDDRPNPSVNWENYYRSNHDRQ
jgi:hypothetical protein